MLSITVRTDGGLCSKILDVLGTSEVKNSSETKMVYIKSENKLKLVGVRITHLEITRSMMQVEKFFKKGDSKSDEVQINQPLPKGMYIINYSDKKESRKFLNN